MSEQLVVGKKFQKDSESDSEPLGLAGDTKTNTCLLCVNMRECDTKRYTVYIYICC